MPQVYDPVLSNVEMGGTTCMQGRELKVTKFHTIVLASVASLYRV